MIAIIDYGFGNLKSVWQALQHVTDETVLITDKKEEIQRATRVVFPGQGAMPDCLKEIEKKGLCEAILKAQQEKPFLGICLGLQLLFEESEEGKSKGLGVVKGKVLRFKGKTLKIPHMGWNNVLQNQKHFLWQNIPQNARFYFVHSYFVQPQDENLVFGKTFYGENFTSALLFENTVAVQFHPEKSAECGLTFLKNFTRWTP